MCWLEGKPFEAEAKGEGAFLYEGDAPIFFASGAPFVRIEGGRVNAQATAMFNKRVRYLHFQAAMSESQVDRTLRPCGRCFAARVSAFVAA